MRHALLSFKSTVTNLLGNHGSSEYVEELLQSFPALGTHKFIKQIICSHLEYLLENCSDFSEEQEKLFHEEVTEPIGCQHACVVLPVPQEMLQMPNINENFREKFYFTIFFSSI